MTTRNALLLLACSFLPALPATAQGPTSEEALGEIVVTAQRRTENLQDVPIQVSAFGAATIEQAGIRSTVDVLTLVPNVAFDQSFTYLNSFITVRGLSQINNADPPVAIVVDGVPQNNQKQARMELFDIERIEVLKGPQGGLYGRNALGGAINIVTRQPSNNFEGFLDARYGNGEAFNTSAAVSGPIVPDRLLFRVSGNFVRDGGRIENAFTGEPVDFIDHDAEGRGQLSFIPNDTMRFDLRGSFRDFRAGSIYDSIVSSGDANDMQPPRANIEGVTFGHIADASLKADIDAGGATFTSITAHTRLVERYRGDLDFSNPRDLPGGFLGLGFQAGQGQDLDLRITSQELRLVSDSSRPFRWVVGAFYLNQRRDLVTRAFVDLDGSIAQYDNPALRIINQEESNNNNAFALYGQFDWDIGEGLIFSAALRYDLEDRRQTNTVTGATRSRSFDDLQPKLTLTYRPSDDKLVYATFSTGFRSGGFNAPQVRIPIFEAETLDNYEVGFKSEWLDNRLRLNGAIFFSRNYNYQFFFIDAATASQIIGNLERVNIWGVEVEAQARVTRELELSAALGTTESNIRESSLFPTATGNYTPKTTPWTLNLTAQYIREIGADASLVLRADYQHRSRRYWQVDNLDVQDPVNMVNLRGGIDLGRFSVFAFGRNILNERFYADFNPGSFSGLPYDIGFRAQPATYGIEGRLRF